jgi:hypothetical protein
VKSPFKVLFSNDTVNTVSCTSPYHAKGEPFSQRLLEASVDETAGTGIDAHMLQPGLSMVPWWKSRQYPYAEHIRWYEQTYGVSVRDNPYARYMLEGGDMVGAFVARCRAAGVAPFVSLRMNDSHGKEFVDTPGGGDIPEIPGYSLHCVNRFYKEHPEFRIDPDPAKVGKEHWNTRVLNWANPEVVNWMFGFIAEICEEYDIDGLELDFMRHCIFFRAEETTFAQRAAVMTGFIRRVRTLLDRTAKPGGHRWLGARIPAYAVSLDPLGLDLRAMTEAGLEILNLSPYYLTAQQVDIAEIRRRAPNAAIHVELTHSVAGVGRVPGAYDNTLFLRTTDEQFYTAAHLAYSRGADGVSAFNFAYFREFGAPGRGPFHEPPFHVFEKIRDQAWVASQPQHYFLSASAGWAVPLGRPLVLPKTLKVGADASFAFDLAPPTGGWKQAGRVRIRARDDLGSGEWNARFNGKPLVATEDRTAPYPTRYDAAHRPVAEKIRAWTLPAGLPREGVNMLEVSFLKGATNAVLEYIDLGLA